MLLGISVPYFAKQETVETRMKRQRTHFIDLKKIKLVDNLYYALLLVTNSYI